MLLKPVANPSQHFSKRIKHDYKQGGQNTILKVITNDISGFELNFKYFQGLPDFLKVFTSLLEIKVLIFNSTFV